MIIDVIGDVHGYADKLTGLLEQLGYVHNGQFFEPKGRKKKAERKK